MKKRALNKDFRMEVKKSMNRFLSIFLIVALGVSFFAGLQSAAPDMRVTEDTYFDDAGLMDIRVISTLGLTEDDVAAIAAVDGVAAVEGTYMEDVYTGGGETQSVLHVEAFPETMNAVAVEAGSLPTRAGECFLDQAFADSMGYEPGDVLEITVEDEDETGLVHRELTITGTGYSPCYIANQRGSTTLGTGSLSGFVYVTADEFDSEVYSVVYVQVEGAKEELAYTDAYDDLVAEVLERIEAIEDVRCEARYTEITEEAESEIAEAESEVEEGRQELEDAKAELEDSKAEAESELNEAESELYDAEEQLSDGKTELEDSKTTVADSLEELSDGEAELAGSESTLADAQSQLSSALDTLNTGESEYQSALEEYESESKAAKKKLKAAQKEIDSGTEQIESGWAQYEEGLAQVEAAEEQIVSAEEQIASAEAAYEQGVSDLAASQSAYDASAAEIEAGKTALETAKAEVAAQQSTYDSGRAALDAAWESYNTGAAELASGQSAYDTAAAQVEALRTSYNTASQAVSSAQSAYDTASSAAGSAQSAYDTAAAAVNSAQAAYDAAVAAVSSAQAEYDTAVAAVSSAQAAYDAAAESGEDTSEAAAQLASAQSALSGKESALTNAQSTLASAQSALDSAKADQSAKQTALDTANASLSSASAALSEAQSAASALQTQLSAAESALSQQKSALDTASAALAATKSQLDEQESALAAAKSALEAASSQISAQEKELAAGETALAAAKTQLEEGQSTLDATAAQLTAARAELETQKEELEAAKAALAETKAQLEASESELSAAQEEVDDGYAQLESAKKQLTSARTELDDGWAQYYSSLSGYNSGKRQLEDGRSQLADARSQIADALEKIAEAEAEIAENEQKIADGWEDYEEGKAEAEQKIADAEQEIADAEEELEEAEQKIADAKAELADVSYPEWYVYDRSCLPENTGYGENADRMTNIAQVFPVIFFLVAALISLTTMTRMVEEERTQIGTLKALGYGKWDVAKKYLKYAFWATLGGSVFGVLFGEKVFPWIIILAYQIMYKYQPAILVPYNWEYGIIASAIAMLCTIGAAFAACYRALGTVPAQLMRPPAPKQGKRVLLERVTFIWKHLNFNWKSTVRNLMRYKGRLMMTVLGIGGCMGLLMVGYGLRDSIGDVGVLQYSELQTYDAMLIYDADADEADQAELTDTVTSEERILAWKRFYMQSMDIADRDASGTGKQWSIYIYVPEDTENLGEFLTFRSRTADEEYTLTDDGAIITEKIAKEFDLSVGDTLTLSLEDGGTAEIPITAICENYLYHYIYLTPALYEKIFGEEPEYNSIFFCTEDAQTEEGQETLEEIGTALLACGASLSITYTESLQETIEDMLSALDLVIIVLIVSAGLLAFVVQYNLNNININERRREMATLKVLGFYDREVSAYIYRENVITTIIGTGAGCLIGKAMHAFIITTVEVDTCMFGRSIYPKSYLFSVLFTVAFSVIVNLAMHFKLKKIDMVESLKSIE